MFASILPGSDKLQLVTAENLLLTKIVSLVPYIAVFGFLYALREAEEHLQRFQLETRRRLQSIYSEIRDCEEGMVLMKARIAEAAGEAEVQARWTGYARELEDLQVAIQESLRWMREEVRGLGRLK